MHLPYNIEDFFVYLPRADFILIFYLSLYYNHLLNKRSVICYGILFDIIETGLMGFYSISYLLLYLMVSSQRKILIQKPFSLHWFAFGLSSASVLIMQNAIIYCLFGKMPFLPSLFTNWLVTFSCYAIFNWLFFYLFNKDLMSRA